MKIEKICVRNFRRLEDVSTSLEEGETVFVGPNNSGKTSATNVFKYFLGQRSFKIYDFSVPKISDIDAFGASDDPEILPSIELDIWFRIDPTTIEFGRAFSLLPKLSDDFELVGVRLSFAPSNPEKMRNAYLEAYPTEEGEVPRKSLSDFLAQDSKLNQFFDISYSSLEDLGGEVISIELDRNEGRSLLRSLIRIDFIDAQRNMDDEEGHRANLLSNAFAGFYKKNLEQAETAAEAQAIIDENNAQLTEHYATQFSDLMDVIKELGVPSINDRDLKIVSTLSPDTALQGTTDLLYVDSERGHELPEPYNGLGFKNLIYMAIQAKHFHAQWLRTEVNRPLCHVIFIEEPEVHLHAQVQQTFIKNIWDVIASSAKAEGEEDLHSQLVVTTHSSHILDAVQFEKVRYFRRCPLAEDSGDASILNATDIHNLRNFQPEKVEIEGQVATEQEALEFLQRYMRLTHCDLFFADAAILVEGAAEKLLLPDIVAKSSDGLRSSYLTILEVGGAYAHRFEGLLNFLKIPYLVITDLDSVSPDGHHQACPANQRGALTSNASLKQMLGLTTIEELSALSSAQRYDTEKDRYITYQRDVHIKEGQAEMAMRARTFEESIVHENFSLIRNGDLNIGIEVPENLDSAYEAIEQHIRSGNFKKTDFAMSLLSQSVDWQPPDYIVEGLKWLEQRLHGPEVTN